MMTHFSGFSILSTSHQLKKTPKQQQQQQQNLVSVAPPSPLTKLFGYAHDVKCTSQIVIKQDINVA